MESGKRASKQRTKRKRASSRRANTATNHAPTTEYFPVVMAGGSHLFPSRTQKLSLHTLMVLGWQRPGRRCSRRIPIGLCTRVHDPDPFLSSSMAEHSAVNRRVVSSSLTWGATHDTTHWVVFLRGSPGNDNRAVLCGAQKFAPSVARPSTAGRDTYLGSQNKEVPLGLLYFSSAA